MSQWDAVGCMGAFKWKRNKWRKHAACSFKFKTYTHYTPLIKFATAPWILIPYSHSTMAFSATKVRQQCRLISHSGSSTDSWQRSIWHCFGHPGGGGMFSSTPSCKCRIPSNKTAAGSELVQNGMTTKKEPTLLQFGLTMGCDPNIDLQKQKYKSSTKTISQPRQGVQSGVPTKSWGPNLLD